MPPVRVVTTAALSLDGKAPFAWLWSDGSTDANRTGLATQAYNGMITDALGCGLSWSLPLEAPPTIVANATVTSATGPTQANGSIVPRVRYWVSGVYFWRILDGSGNGFSGQVVKIN